MIKFLDEMKKLNLNVLHWHLTEDQGWRVEKKPLNAGLKSAHTEVILILTVNLTAVFILRRI